jgi:hypothetical protein
LANRSNRTRWAGSAAAISAWLSIGWIQHDRINDAEDVTEGAHVVAPLRQVPRLARPILAAAVATVVEIDDLRNIGQQGVQRPFTVTCMA